MQSESKVNAQRRNVLKTGMAVAFGAALLPKVGQAASSQRVSGDPLPALRADYAKMLQEIAREVRPGFESGRFRGFRDEEGSDCPRWVFEMYLMDRHVPTYPVAYAILAASPSEPLVDDGSLSEARVIAAEALGLDLFRIGLRAGWYRPEPGEEPSAEELQAKTPEQEEDAA